MGYYLRTQGIHPLPGDPMTPSATTGPVNVGPAGYISLKELDENASKVLLGFRRWAIAECLATAFEKKRWMVGKGMGGGGVYGN